MEKREGRAGTEGGLHCCLFVCKLISISGTLGACHSATAGGESATWLPGHTGPHTGGGGPPTHRAEGPHTHRSRGGGKHPAGGIRSERTGPAPEKTGGGAHKAFTVKQVSARRAAECFSKTSLRRSGTRPARWWEPCDGPCISRPGRQWQSRSIPVTSVTDLPSWYPPNDTTARRILQQSFIKSTKKHSESFNSCLLQLCIVVNTTRQ